MSTWLNEFGCAQGPQGSQWKRVLRYKAELKALCTAYPTACQTSKSLSAKCTSPGVLMKICAFPISHWQVASRHSARVPIDAVKDV